MRESTDAGATWSNPIRVNDDPVSNDRMQDMLWGDFDILGNLIVAWRDRRNGTGSGYETAYEIMGAYRSHDATSFSANFSISDMLIPYDNILAYAGNDFMCVKLTDSKLNAVWGDTRNSSLNIWFQQTDINDIITGIEQVHSEEDPGVKIYPNPTSTIIFIEGEDIKNILLYNPEGKEINRYKNTDKIDISQLPAGSYIVKVITSSGVLSKKIIID